MLTAFAQHIFSDFFSHELLNILGRFYFLALHFVGKEIDSAIRQPLWEIGVDYPHETGHGIAHYGVVVEGPARISSSRASYTSDIPLETNFFGYGRFSRQMFVPFLIVNYTSKILLHIMR